MSGNNYRFISHTNFINMNKGGRRINMCLYFCGMMKIRVALLAGILLATLPGNSQEHQQTGWLASFNTIKISSKWSVHAEFQLRSTNHWAQVQTVLPRIGINYHIRKNQVITAGYALIPNRVFTGGYNGLVSEHRVWQQYLLNQTIGSTVLTHRLRLEERFTPRAIVVGDDVLAGDRVVSVRARYFARAVIPFKKQVPFVKGPFIGLQEEAFVNVAGNKNVNGQFFDQNRAYVAFGYRVSKQFDVEAGYLNQFVVRIKGQENLMNHVVQLAFYTRL